LIFWRCFADLSAGRRFGAHGPDPIPLADILAWGELHKMQFEGRHVAVIRALDAVWLKDATKKPVAKPLTPEGFDAVFG
jgi:hypothetical protein